MVLGNFKKHAGNIRINKRDGGLTVLRDARRMESRAGKVKISRL